LTRNFEVEEHRVLFLGDHDLTSVALGLLHPNAETVVVDVDERLLSYIDTLSASHGWQVRTVFGDLRIHLPRSLREKFDLVFSDPPYTPAGIRLFMERAIGSLKHEEFNRVLLSYGFN